MHVKYPLPTQYRLDINQVKKLWTEAFHACMFRIAYRLFLLRMSENEGCYKDSETPHFERMNIMRYDGEYQEMLTANHNNDRMRIM